MSQMKNENGTPKNLTATELSRTLGELDAKYIAEAESYKKRISPSILKKFSIISAACLCLCITIIFSSIGILNIINANKMPPYHGVNLTPEDILGVFDGQYYASPSESYISEFYAADKQLPLSPVPKDAQAVIYAKNQQYRSLTKSELKDLTSSVMPKLAEEFDMPYKDWTVGKISNNEAPDASLKVSYRYDKYSISFEQFSGNKDPRYSPCRTEIQLGALGQDQSLTLAGRAIEVNRRQSEDEILASFEWLKEKLCNIFDCSMDSAIVKFNYSLNGASRVDIIYYNSADVNKDLLTHENYISGYINYIPHIYIRFLHQFTAPQGDTLNDVDISYFIPRTDEELYKPVATYDLLSIEEAEQMLYNGYSFDGGGYTFRGDVKPIVFDSYDYVGYEYVCGDNYAVPFYTFYKKIEAEKNGIAEYAKTYVCAIVSPDLKDYLESKKTQASKAT